MRARALFQRASFLFFCRYLFFFFPLLPRDILNNQCHLQSNPYPPFAVFCETENINYCVRFLFRSRRRRARHTDESTKHTGRGEGGCARASPETYLHTPPTYYFLLHAHKFISPQKSSLFLSFFFPSPLCGRVRGAWSGARRAKST